MQVIEPFRRYHPRAPGLIALSLNAPNGVLDLHAGSGQLCAQVTTEPTHVRHHHCRMVSSQGLAKRVKRLPEALVDRQEDRRRASLDLPQSSLVVQPAKSVAGPDEPEALENDEEFRPGHPHGVNTG